MNYCIYCGSPLDSDSQFCANCGKKIYLCPRCGAVLKEDSLFCAKCGTRIDTQTVPFINSPQVIYPTKPLQEKEIVVDELEEEDKNKWIYLLGGIAIVVLLTISWIGYNQFYKYTHINVHELLENLQLPKDYYHSAKEIVNKPDFELQKYQKGRKYALRGWIVYNQKYGNEIKFNNSTFRSDNYSLDDYYWTIGHIMDCWNTSPAEAKYEFDHDGYKWVSNTSTFYYTSNKSRGIQFAMINDYDKEGNPIFQSVDGKYEANFKQVHLN